MKIIGADKVVFCSHYYFPLMGPPTRPLTKEEIDERWQRTMTELDDARYNFSSDEEGGY